MIDIDRVPDPSHGRKPPEIAKLLEIGRPPGSVRVADRVGAPVGEVHAHCEPSRCRASRWRKVIGDPHFRRGHHSEIGQPNLSEVLFANILRHPAEILSPIKVGIEQVQSASHRSAGQLVEIGQVVRMKSQRQRQRGNRQRHHCRTHTKFRPIEPACGLRRGQIQQRQRRKNVSNSQLHPDGTGQPHQHQDRQPQERLHADQPREPGRKHDAQHPHKTQRLGRVREFILKRAQVVLVEPLLTPLPVEVDRMGRLHHPALMIESFQIITR